MRSLTAVDLRNLWRVSALVFENPGVRALRSRLLFMRAAVRHQSETVSVLRASNRAIARLYTERPQILGALVWPYISHSWDVSTRFSAIRGHWSAAETVAQVLNFSCRDEVELISLDSLTPGLRLVLDQPEWFLREGQATLNLFINDTRFFSLSFSLLADDVLTAYVGGIQGRSIEGATETYKALTAALFGMRPRDFLVEAFRAFACALTVSRILAVSDAGRHQHHAYFGGKVPRSVNYDEIWRERGGALSSADFFELPVSWTRHKLDEIPSKKRSMYRRRYEMLEGMESTFRAVIAEKDKQSARSILFPV